MFSLILIMGERNTYLAVKQQSTERQEALDKALNAAAAVLKNSIYEDEVQQKVQKTFIYVWAICMEAIPSEDIIENMIISSKEEKVMSAADFKRAKSGDEMVLYVELKAEEIKLPGRKIVIRKSGTRSVTLD